MQYRSEIDGLRAIAVIPVILYHSGSAYFSGGFIGVDVFFVISGYLITTQILEGLNNQDFSFVSFYAKRARRILPPLYVMTFVCIFFANYFFYPTELEKFYQSILAVCGFGSNIFFSEKVGYFDPTTELMPLIHTWSLGVEEQFYLMAPLIILLLCKIFKKWIAPIILIMGATSFVYALLLLKSNTFSSFYMLQTRAWEIILGSIVAFNYKTFTDLYLNKFELFGGIVGLLLILFPIFLYQNSTPYPSFYTLAPVTGSILVILCARGENLLGKFFGTKVLVFLGLLSYGAYLWHQPISAFSRYIWPENHDYLFSLILLYLSFLAAYLSWRYIERPFRTMVVENRMAFLLYIASTVTLVVIAIFGIKTHGFLSSYTSEQQNYFLNRKEGEAYTWKRMFDLNGVNFKPNTYKVMIIGDSFAGDFINAVFENQPSTNVSFSSHVIWGGCGNLFVDFDFIKNIPVDRINDCSETKWYRNSNFQKLLGEADEVWLASNWSAWEIKLLRESLGNIKKFGPKNITIIGKKPFGSSIPKRELFQLIANPVMKRPLVLRGVSANDLQINAKLAMEYPGEFFNYLNAVCMDEVNCRIFDDNGKILSYDGKHTTLEGALFYGNIFKRSEKFEHIFR